MNVVKTKLEGVVVIEPTVFGDDRGFFLESYNQRHYAEAGIHASFVQDNHSRSGRGVLRGLHFQKTKPQGKLVRVTHGEVYDVAVDVNLSSENHKLLYVPPGYAHGFVVLSESADFQYKCTEFYDVSDEGGIAWDDGTLSIDWPIKNPVLSDKDIRLPSLKEHVSATT